MSYIYKNLNMISKEGWILFSSRPKKPSTCHWMTKVPFEKEQTTGWGWQVRGANDFLDDWVCRFYVVRLKPTNRNRGGQQSPSTVLCESSGPRGTHGLLSDGHDSSFSTSFTYICCTPVGSEEAIIVSALRFLICFQIIANVLFLPFGTKSEVKKIKKKDIKKE